MEKRGIERILNHIQSAGNSEDMNFFLGKIITSEPNVTIQIHGSTKALPSTFFIMPNVKFSKNETVLIQRISSAGPTDRQFVVKPLHESVTLCRYTGSEYVAIADKTVRYPASQTFCPWNIAVGTNVMLLPNRFPSTNSLWVVINTYAI
ncbi:hypothetical protein U3450_003947 [Bacillus cytotoxicus]|uniref:hypothetical protein n=1 Tax=unclassified Bacillus cereus group TaxID=2750818 RepID=UPI001F5A2AB2|nr:MULTISPECIES: hypothetical protein [unclassified Bacillus cereus group]EMA6344889.1 hypothetical protein [Bacillus cytotoxicus]